MSQRYSLPTLFCTPHCHLNVNSIWFTSTHRIHVCTTEKSASQGQHCLWQTAWQSVDSKRDQPSDQVQSVLCSCPPCTTVHLWNLDGVQSAHQETKLFPHEMTEKPAAHQMAGQSPRHWSTGEGRYGEHFCHAEAFKPQMGRTCVPHVRQATAKETHVHWAEGREALPWRPAQTVQEHSSLPWKCCNIIKGWSFHLATKGQRLLHSMIY